jgi:hypothetical protein
VKAASENSSQNDGQLTDSQPKKCTSRPASLAHQRHTRLVHYVLIGAGHSKCDRR